MGVSADRAGQQAAALRQAPLAARQWWLLNSLLLLAVMTAAFANIQSTHTCRALYSQLQVLESKQWFMQEDYHRLLIEQSYWASHYRVESEARTELGMRAPDLARFKVVSP